MLKAPAKKSAKGLNIQNEHIQEPDHRRNGSSDTSDVSYESASEKLQKTVWLFDEESVEKLRIQKPAKKATKPFEYCDSILDDAKSNDKADDVFKLAAQ